MSKRKSDIAYLIVTHFANGENRSKLMVCKKLIIMLLILAGGLFSHAEMTGNWVMLTNSTVNAVGITNGWNTSYWDDGRAPHSDADYLVTRTISGSSITCHTPRWGVAAGSESPTNCVFGGNSLVITNGATLALVCVDRSCSPDAPIRVTVPNDGIIAERGGICSQYADGWANIFGKVTIKSVHANAFRFTSSRNDMKVVTVLKGALIGSLESECSVSGNSSHYTLRLDGDCSQYFGKIVVGNSSISNDLDLCSVTLPGHVEVRKNSRVQLSSSACLASVGSLTMKNQSVIGVSIDGADHSNGTLTVLEAFSQESGFIVCLTNYLDATAAVRQPPNAILKLASTATAESLSVASFSAALAASTLALTSSSAAFTSAAFSSSSLIAA